ncbi:hypothetical protein LS684_02135 [Cytobacillus spongiae]|jgi:hypothetical protein|uniref:hypothetical protein n=1 Tax=Cytobacillus spongiae TaxID=2901381 RepID=UPI001F1FA913|nr:hypothetical protein [Cytobacillus spongiae]UII56311.1 hypothetical protein LS684_02135 [Cytobacillus spongiae]
MFKEVLYFYNQGLLKIIGFTLILVLPLEVFFYGWIFYTSSLDLGSIETVLILYIHILMFIVTQKPFMLLYHHLKINEDFSILEMFQAFLKSFGFILFAGILVFIISYLGTMLFILPGLMALTFAFFLPFYKDTTYSMKQEVVRALKFYRSHFITIHSDILLWVSVHVLIWAVFINGVAVFELTMITYSVLRILINLFLFPLIYFYLTEKYQEL